MCSHGRWKIHEACMLALGSVKTIITENVKNGRIQFDMHGFLAGVILADLNLAGGRRACFGTVDSPPHSTPVSVVDSCLLLWVPSDQQRLRSSWVERCGQPAASRRPCHPS